jgi:hypothetical protein
MKYSTQRSSVTGKLNGYVASHKGIAVRIARFEAHPMARSHMSGTFYKVYIGLGTPLAEFARLSEAKAFVAETLGA